MCDCSVLIKQALAAVNAVLQLFSRAGEILLAHLRTLHQRPTLGENRLLIQEEGGYDHSGGLRVHDLCRNPLDLLIERVYVREKPQTDGWATCPCRERGSASSRCSRWRDCAAC